MVSKPNFLAKSTFVRKVNPSNILICTGFLLGGSNYYTQYKTIRFPYHTRVWNGIDLWDNETPVWYHERRYSTRAFTRKALDIINQHDEAKVFNTIVIHW